MKNIIKWLLPEGLKKKYREFKKNRRRNPHDGNSVECPICSAQFKYFAPFGVVERKNARCYKCDSLERHRLLWKYFTEKVDFFKGETKGKVLHFAPEKVFYEFIDKFENIEYVPCDLFPEQYQFIGKSETKKVDITDIPFENNYFDFIICNHVLEHIPDDNLAMSELYRVMKKGGHGVFQVPIDYKREVTYEDFSIISLEGREKAFGQRDHVRQYGLDYKNRLEKAGFNVKEDDYVKSFSQKEIKKYGLMSSELIYYCTK